MSFAPHPNAAGGPLKAEAPLRVLVVSSYFDTHLGGLELVAGRLARELASDDLHVTWIATNASRVPDDPQVVSIAIPASNLFEEEVGLPLPILHPRSVRTLFRAIGSADVVLIHDTLYLTSVAALVSAKLLRKPTIILQHIGDALFETRAVQRMMTLAEWLVSRPSLKAADRVVYISEIVAKHFSDLRLRRQASVSLSGIDVAHFRPPKNSDEKRKLRAGFGLSEERRVALYAGRFVGKKGVAYLRTVATSAPDIDFALAGSGPIDPESWGLPNVHVFRGLSGEPLANLYRAADVFVLPSPSESFSLVIREALATGLPVVCGEQAANADPQAFHYLSVVPLSMADPERNAAALKAALVGALADPLQDDRAAFARHRYDWRTVAGHFRVLLEELGGRRGGTLVAAAHPQ